MLAIIMLDIRFIGCEIYVGSGDVIYFAYQYNAIAIILLLMT
jgi:hypothetical protein